MGFMDRFRRRGDSDQPDPAAQGEQQPPAPVPGHASGRPAPETQREVADHPAAEPTWDAVQQYWDRIGPSDDDRISYLLNPMFTGAPRWPGPRQSYRVVRTQQTVILASDGLADPGPDADSRNQGFGCEVFLETTPLVGADFEQIRASPFFPAIENFAQNVADLGGISQLLQQHGVLSMELPIGELMPELQTERGTVGALIGLSSGRPPTFAGPLGAIDVVPLTLISPAELEAIVAGGAEARDRLAAQRSQSGAGHVTVLR